MRSALRRAADPGAAPETCEERRAGHEPLAYEAEGGAIIVLEPGAPLGLVELRDRGEGAGDRLLHRPRDAADGAARLGAGPDSGAVDARDEVALEPAVNVARSEERRVGKECRL